MERLKLFQIILMSFVMALLSVSSVYSEDIKFEITLEHDFDDEDDDPIDCELNYYRSGELETKTFDLEYDDDTYSIEKSFEKEIELDCNENVDDIEYRIFDADDGDKKIDDEDFSREDGFTYELDLVDEDDDWFRIDIEHDFGSKEIDCDLEIDDEGRIKFSFDEDSDSDDLRIERNYDEKIEFTCDDELDEIDLRVFDDDGDEIFDKLYEDDNGFDYDEDEDAKNRLILTIEHSYKDGEEITCELDIDDGDERKNYVFNEDSDNEVIEQFLDEFEFDCDEELDEIDVKIYDEDDDKVDEIEYEDEDKFDYEFDVKEYDVFVEINHRFESDEEIDCELLVDGKIVEKIEYSSSSSLGDRRLEDEFDSEVRVECDERVDNFLVIIFDSDDDDEIDRREYSDVSSFDYKYGEDDVELIEVEPTPEVVEEPEEIEDTSSENLEPEFEEFSESTTSDAKNTLENENNAPESEVGSEEIIEETTEEENKDISVEDNTSSGNHGLTLFLVIAILVMIAFIVLLSMIKPKPKKRRF